MGKTQFGARVVCNIVDNLNGTISSWVGLNLGWTWTLDERLPDLTFYLLTRPNIPSVIRLTILAVQHTFNCTNFFLPRKIRLAVCWCSCPTDILLWSSSFVSLEVYRSVWPATTRFHTLEHVLFLKQNSGNVALNQLRVPKCDTKWYDSFLLFYLQ